LQLTKSASSLISLISLISLLSLLSLLWNERPPPVRQRHNSDLFVKGKPRTHRSHNKHQGTVRTSPQIT